MTVVIRAEIVCNKCNFKLDGGERDDTISGEELRQWAHDEFGWIEEGGRDFCYECQVELEDDE